MSRVNKALDVRNSFDLMHLFCLGEFQIQCETFKFSGVNKVFFAYSKHIFIFLCNWEFKKAFLSISLDCKRHILNNS